MTSISYETQFITKPITAKERQKAYSAEWYRKNKDRVREQRRLNMARFNASPNGTYKGISWNGRKRGYGVCSREEFLDWYTPEPKVCAYCQIPEEFLVQIGFRRLEIDRKNNEIGYLIGNMVLACRLCNNAKSKYLTYEEMKIVGESFKALWKIKCQQ